MSAPIVLVLGADRVHVLVKGRAGKAFDVPWSPSAPETMITAVLEQTGATSAVVLVVGLAFLEIAEPELPPLSADAKRALLWRDADRYFPVSDSVALTSTGTVALAAPAALVEQWVQAVTALGPVRAIIAAPQLCSRFAENGVLALDAGPGEVGLVTLTSGELTSVRRVMARGVSAPKLANQGILEASMLAGEAVAFVDAPLDVQLLDRSLWTRMQGARHRRVLASVALALASVVILVWSANRWRDNVLTATEARATQLETQVQPAQMADNRLQKARAELQLLHDASVQQLAPESPLMVLALLTKTLPREAFVQKLEWDGQQWRVDGTTDNAPRLIPLLDAVADFRDVRTVAPGQRFLDAGRQRESFAISFRMTDGGGTHGQP